MNYAACICPHCEQKIEYPEELSNQVIPCPTCQGELTLPQSAKPGLIDSLVAKWKIARENAADKRKLVSLLCDAVADGILTPEEITQIEQLMSETGLSIQDLARARRAIFKNAMKSLDRSGYSLEKILGIEAIQNFLKIANSEIPAETAKLARLKFLASIRLYGPSPIDPDNLVLRRGETAHWQEPGTLYENKVVSRRYEGGSRGMSIRVIKGLSFRVGSHRGHLVSQTANVPVSTGNLLITNQRLIFVGREKSFETKFENLLDIQNFFNGIVYSERNRQKQRKILYTRNNGDIVTEILSYFLDNHSVRESPPQIAV